MEWTLFHAVNGMAGHSDRIDGTLEFAARSLPLLLIPLLAFWFWPGSRAASAMLANEPASSRRPPPDWRSR